MANWGPVRFPDYTVQQFQQPKQKFSFVTLFQLPIGLTEGGLSNAKQLSNDQLPRDFNPQASFAYTGNGVDMSDLLSMSTKTFPDVTWSVNTATDNHFYNGHIHWQGTRNYTDSIQLSFREYVGSPITRILNQWQKVANDPVTNNIGYQNKYKGVIVKLDVDPNVIFADGNIEEASIQGILEKTKEYVQKGFDSGLLDNILTRQIVFEGQWPSSISEVGGDYSSTGDLIDVSCTFHVDRYYEDTDWGRHLGSPQPIKTLINAG